MKVSSHIFGIITLVTSAAYFGAAITPLYCPNQNRNVLPRFFQNAGSTFCNNGVQKCDPENIYYSVNGSCNNLFFPNYGLIGTAFTRVVAANYSDGVCALRTCINGSPLPLARKITTTILLNKDIASKNLNIMFYGFGQWLDHDVTHQQPINSPVQCCINGQPAPSMPGDICLATIIPPNDTFYSQFGVTCLDLKRSINTETVGCTNVTPCFQINYETGALDLSILYGPDALIAANLRTFIGGLLKTTIINGYEFPQVVSGRRCPAGGLKPQPFGMCFLAGDNRINTNPELCITSIIFVNTHNYIARTLKILNPLWTDEQLYQQARRIVIAIYQVIAFKEYAPLLVGPETAWLNKLYPSSNDYAIGYNPKINLQTLDVFEAGAARTLHSQILGKVNFEAANGEQTSYILKDQYFNQGFMTQSNMTGNMVRAFTTQPCSNQDQYFTDQITNFLYFFPGAEYGLDLAAIDILRGRDHGLATYNAYRQACGLCRLHRFADLADEIKDPSDVAKLQALYQSIDDVDFYVGAILEKPLPGAAVGPTLACALGEALRRYKYGDRFHYEFLSAKFTSAQRATLKKVTYSFLLCLTNPNLTYVYTNSFTIPSPQNRRIPCSAVPQMDFSLWKNAIV